MADCDPRGDMLSLGTASTRLLVHWPLAGDPPGEKLHSGAMTGREGVCVVHRQAVYAFGQSLCLDPGADAGINAGSTGNV